MRRFFLLIFFLFFTKTSFANISEELFFKEISFDEIRTKENKKLTTIIETPFSNHPECKFDLDENISISDIKLNLSIYDKNNLKLKISEKDLNIFFNSKDYQRNPITLIENNSYDKSIGDDNIINIKENIQNNKIFEFQYVDKCLTKEEVNRIESIVEDRIYSFKESFKIVIKDFDISKKKISSLWFKNKELLKVFSKKNINNPFPFQISSNCYTIFNILSVDSYDSYVDDYISYQNSMLVQTLTNNKVEIPFWYKKTQQNNELIQGNSNFKCEDEVCITIVNDDKIFSLTRFIKLSFLAIINDKIYKDNLIVRYLNSSNYAEGKKIAKISYSFDNLKDFYQKINNIPSKTLNYLLMQSILNGDRFFLFNDIVLFFEIKSYKININKELCQYSYLKNIDDIHSKVHSLL